MLRFSRRQTYFAILRINASGFQMNTLQACRSGSPQYHSTIVFTLTPYLRLPHPARCERFLAFTGHRANLFIGTVVERSRRDCCATLGVYSPFMYVQLTKSIPSYCIGQCLGHSSNTGVTVCIFHI